MGQQGFLMVGLIWNCSMQPKIWIKTALQERYTKIYFHYFFFLKNYSQDFSRTAISVTAGAQGVNFWFEKVGSLNICVNHICRVYNLCR